ncbi:MAG: F0F1 ATP synthase subunit epsilon [Candidatus Omnitrophota bacterium]
MNKLFRLSIYTPYKTVFEGEASMLSVPGSTGYLQVLSGHAPIVVNLTKGRVTYRDRLDKTVSFDIEGKGVLEVLKNNATLLLENTL